MGRYWEVETDPEGLAPVKAGCGASGRRERANSYASGRRERAARVDGAGGRRERAMLEGGAEAMVCRWGGIGKIPAPAPLGAAG